ncbi:MAG: NusG domain II-containing protein [Oscillospiraceae bacterium]|nr:NusG domain II-containing protein [Oscillospiraceae bacterium]
MKKIKYKSNIFWILVLIGITVLSIAAMLLTRQASGTVAKIYLYGELIKTVNLATVTEPYSMIIEADSGRSNTVLVEKGRIRVTQADCRDGICVQQGWIYGGLMPIVCLPHGLAIQIDGGAYANIDAAVG